MNKWELTEDLYTEDPKAYDQLFDMELNKLNTLLQQKYSGN
jgi:hypothetical protein